MLPAAITRMRREITEAARCDFVGKLLGDLPTPFLVVDMDVVERNLAAMQRYCSERKLLLRPHAKMHKSRTLSALQVRNGAIGMCVQKISEAEQLAGLFDEVERPDTVRNLFISNEVTGMAKLRRVAHLAAFLHKGLDAATSHNRLDRYLAVAVDSVEGVVSLAEALREQPTFVHVLIEVNIGQSRGGCPPTVEALTPICTAICNAHDVLVFDGLHAYHGAAQHVRSVADRQAIMAHSIALAQQAKNIIEAHMPVRIVTGAGTGTFFIEGNSNVYNEVQPGSYLVMDRDYGENGGGGGGEGAPPLFEHALYLQCTVGSYVDTADGSRIVLDAGHKSAAVDCGGPAVAPFCLRDVHVDGVPYIVAENGGDDHCTLRSPCLKFLPSARQAPPSAPQAATLEANLFKRYGCVGATLWLIPGHCDPTFNLHDYVICVRGLATAENPRAVVVEDVIAVDCRGCQQ